MIGVVTDEAVDAVVDRSRADELALEAHADEHVGVDAQRARECVQLVG